MVSLPRNAEEVVSTEGTALYEQWSKSATNHKALDFSNIGMPLTAPGGANAGDEKHLRQFHQTRIFIENYGEMRHHTEQKQMSSTYLISANLPESFSYGIGSKWSAPLSDFGGSTFNMLMQLGGSVVRQLPIEGLDGVKDASGIHRAAHLLIWGGSEPLEFSLTIPVIDDNYGTKTVNDISTNLVEALEFLGCLCLPGGTNAAGFYTPPPSPLNVNIGITDGFDLNMNSNFARIMVQIGGILLVDRCILKKVSVEYPNTKTLIKHTYPQGIRPGETGTSYLTPLLAKVTITFSTIEAMTSDLYSRMLWLKPQEGAGTLSSDALKPVGNFVRDKIVKPVGNLMGLGGNEGGGEG